MALLKFLQGPLQVSRPKYRFRSRVDQARAPRFCSAGAANSAAENGFLCGVYAGTCRRFGRMSGSAPTLMRKDLAGTRCPGKPRHVGHKRVTAARLRRSITDCPD